jgi:hypothetical protein
MHCERCSGLMVMDHYRDAYSGGHLWHVAMKCVNCGDVIDSQIAKQRLMRGRQLTPREKMMDKPVPDHSQNAGWRNELFRMP